MAKSTITRKSALSAAIIAFDFLNMEAIRPEGMPDVDYMEVKEVLGNMLAQISKPRAKAVSKARKMNENLATEIAKILPAEGLTSKQIVELGNPAITTTQKAAAVMRVAEEMGLAVKVKDGKKISYQPAENDGEDA
jgi:CHAT domain-containing protein